ncbi:bifunctional 4-hydroxy-3-methylbut-2-enyl diphosphate reductase/30S ribosomal protein S1 [Clostridia bacterium]|nr:bifunctional 4-hydroxy-3-methylbut-2-enyl diphosphate reductase/30S ribosomal protein S1 [Clostridia bacterium]
MITGNSGRIMIAKSKTENMASGIKVKVEVKVEIVPAKTAGMCFGTQSALDTVLELVKSGKTVFTLGEIVHNEDVVDSLAKKGVRVIDTLDGNIIAEAAAIPNSVVVIRSHGVPAAVTEELSRARIAFRDATCPYVKKIQSLAREVTEKGETLILVGDKNHPEVIGIAGHASGDSRYCRVVSDEIELEELLRERTGSVNDNCDTALNFAAQTTYNCEKWHKCEKIIEKHCTNAKIFDTICKATVKRQEEAAELSRRCEICVVVGSHSSSNTRKLYEICRENTVSYLVSNAEVLDKLQLREKIKLLSVTGQFPGTVRIGVTGGASAPAEKFKEVLDTMQKEFENLPDGNTDGYEEYDKDGFDFMAEVDKTFKKVYIGNRVKATVIAVNDKEATVDIGTKQTGYIPADELTADNSRLPSEIVSVGDVIDCVVVSINDVEGEVGLSKKRVDSALGLEKIATAYDDNTSLSGTVISVVKGGIIVVCDGARIFIPASQTGLPRNAKLDDLLKKTVTFKVIEVNENRSRVVGSIRAANKDVNDAARLKFWAEIAVGQKFTGEVKSMENYGVFVDLGGVDGMVHLTELSWNRIKHPRDVVSIGDKLDVYIKSFDLEKRRVSLGAKNPDENPWRKFAEDFHVGDNANVQIVSITPFGAFAQIVPGVDGLIHISQISRERVTNVAAVLSVGEKVDVKIIDITPETSRISLSIKALLEPEQGGQPEVTVASIESGSAPEIAE